MGPFRLHSCGSRGQSCSLDFLFKRKRARCLSESVYLCVCALPDTVHKAPGAACLSMSRGRRLSQLNPWQQLAPAQSWCANTTISANFRQNPLWFLTAYAKTASWWRNCLVHCARLHSRVRPGVTFLEKLFRCISALQKVFNVQFSPFLSVCFAWYIA